MLDLRHGRRARAVPPAGARRRRRGRELPAGSDGEVRPRLRRRCRPISPGLVYASISGYGQTGPWAGRGGFDLVAQGVTGIMSVTGEAGRPPVKAGLPITDLGAGLFALAGILAALHHRDRTGQGQHIDTSLMEAGLALSVWEAAEYFGGRGVPGPLGIGTPDERALPGLPLRRWLHHGGRRQPADLREAGWRRSAIPSGPPMRASPPTTRAWRTATVLAAHIEAVTATGTRAEWLDDVSTPPASPAGRSSTTPRRSTRAGAGPRDGGESSTIPTLGRVRTIGTPLKLSAYAARRAGAGRRDSASTPMRCSARSAIRRPRWPHCVRERCARLRSRRPLSSGMQSLLAPYAPTSTRCFGSSPDCSSSSTACRSSSVALGGTQMPLASQMGLPGIVETFGGLGHRPGRLHRRRWRSWPAGRWRSPTSRRTCRAGSGRFRTAASSPSSTASSSSTSPRAGRGSGACAAAGRARRVRPRVAPGAP